MSMLEHVPGSAAAGRGYLWSKFGPARLLNRALSLFGAFRSRAAITSLRDLDDTQLADIGLTRNDVERALDTPLTMDPSQHLLRAQQNPLRGLRRS